MSNKVLLAYNKGTKVWTNPSIADIIYFDPTPDADGNVSVYAEARVFQLELLNSKGESIGSLIIDSDPLCKYVRDEFIASMGGGQKPVAPLVEVYGELLINYANEWQISYLLLSAESCVVREVQLWRSDDHEEYGWDL